MKTGILKFTCIVTIIMSMFISPVYAKINSSKLSITADKETYDVGEEVTITFRLDSLDADKGIIAYGATLEYDKNVLEYVRMSGVGNWGKPSYNKDNGKLIADSDDYSSLNGEILCKIVFKVKSRGASTKVVLKDISIANGGNGPAYHNDIETTIKIKEASITPSNPSGSNGNGNNSGNSSSSNSSQNKQDSDNEQNSDDEQNTTDSSDNSSLDNSQNEQNSNANNSNINQNTEDEKEEDEKSSIPLLVVILGIVVIGALVLFTKKRNNNY